MTVERALRGIAGLFILLSLAAGWSQGQVELNSPTWLWFTAFIGLNLLQSAFSNWCPMIALLRRLGLRPEGPSRVDA